MRTSCGGALARGLGGVLAAAAIAGVAYIALVALVVLLLSFPGLGVVLLPQPLLGLHSTGKTVSYEFGDLRTAAWAVYVLVTHSALYYAAVQLAKLRRPYVLTSVALYALNLALVLAGLSDWELVRLVRTYTLGYALALPGLVLTVAIEWLGHRLGRPLAR